MDTKILIPDNTFAIYNTNYERPYFLDRVADIFKRSRSIELNKHFSNNSSSSKLFLFFFDQNFELKN